MKCNHKHMSYTAAYLPRWTPHMLDGHCELSLGMTKPLDIFISPWMSRYFNTAVRTGMRQREEGV